jgi:hypothetical protein
VVLQDQPARVDAVAPGELREARAQAETPAKMAARSPTLASTGDRT